MSDSQKKLSWPDLNSQGPNASPYLGGNSKDPPSLDEDLVSQPSGESLAKAVVRYSEGKDAGNIRKQLVEPPRGLKWGGRIVTDRDLEFCICGLPSGHKDLPPGHYCKRVQLLIEKEKRDVERIEKSRSATERRTRLHGNTRNRDRGGE